MTYTIIAIAVFIGGIGLLSSLSEPNKNLVLFISLFSGGTLALIFVTIMVKRLNRVIVPKSIDKEVPAPREEKTNLTPFQSADKLIKQIYPGEKIRSKKLSIDMEFGFIKVGSVPIIPTAPLPFGSFKNDFIKLPMPVVLIEGDENYYIDKRLQNFLYLIILALVFGLFFAYLASTSPDAAIIFAPFVLLLFMVPLAYFLFWQTANIEVIKRSWVSNTVKKGHLLTLIGTIPKNVQPTLSTDKSLETGQSISIPFTRLFFQF